MRDILKQSSPSINPEDVKESLTDLLTTLMTDEDNSKEDLRINIPESEIIYLPKKRHYDSKKYNQPTKKPCNNLYRNKLFIRHKIKKR